MLRFSGMAGRKRTLAADEQRLVDALDMEGWSCPRSRRP
jgi:hypothetical protein